MPPRERDQIPAQLGRYQIVSRIGKGGMAHVYHARLQSLGGFERDVAVKVLLPELSAEPDFVDMLLDEARLAGAICHPCVVQVLDVGREGEDELFYIVMEYIDGPDLRSRLREVVDHRLPPAAALYVIGELLRGLGAVHSAVGVDGKPQNIIHRDVSPANVLIDKQGQVRIGDFGIAHASVRLTRTRNGAIKGKLRYMAPEQTSQKPVDHRADLYAAGVVLCELLLGPAECEPRRDSELGRTFSWPRVKLRRPDLMPRDVSAILDKALTESSADRYLDAAAFRRDVVSALHRLHPGFGPEELVQTFAVLDKARVVAAAGGSDGPTDPHHTEKHPLVTPPNGLPVVVPPSLGGEDEANTLTYARPPGRESEAALTVRRAKLRPVPSTKAIVAAVAVTVALALLIPWVVWLITRKPVVVPTPQIAPPVAQTPVAPPEPAPVVPAERPKPVASPTRSGAQRHKVSSSHSSAGAKGR